jgi:hypothetical protein
MPNKIYNADQKNYVLKLFLAARKSYMVGLSNQSRRTLPSPQKSNTRRIALFSVLVAVCVSLQVVKPFPFVEFTSILAFSTGIVFGSLFGASLGAIVMFVNAFLSPWGLAGLNMPFQMLGMSIIGAVGGFYKIDNGYNVQFFAETAVLGAFLTFIYYLITNVGFAFYTALSGIPILEAVVLMQATGAVFTLIYVVSNTFLFGVGTVPLVNAMRKLLGR